MKILVTGHNGFIGKNMLAWCQNEEGWHVDGYDWHPTERPDVSSYDWVIHLGAITDNSYTDIDAILAQNLDFSQWLFKECQHHGVHFQFASTSEVYLKDTNETSALYPRTPVAWSKYLFERWLFQQPIAGYAQVFRYFNVYGRYMHQNQHRGNESDIIAYWKQQGLTAGLLTVPANAENIRRDWVWVGDVCRLHIDFIKTVNGSGIWNVGSGLTHSLLDIAEELVELDDYTVELGDAHSGPSKICADLTHLKDTIGKRKWLNLFEFLDQ